MFKVEALPAGPGDALVVEYGTAGTKHRLLVDAGPKHWWPDVRSRLARRRSDVYEVFVVTHIDEDHIGGALEMLDDRDLRTRIRSVWFNGYIHCDKGGNVLGPVHGEQFTLKLNDGGYGWNRGWPNPVAPTLGGPVVVPSRGPLPTLDLPGGARVVLLGPSGPQLKRLAREWTKVVVKAGLVPGEGAAGEGAAVRQRPKERDPLPPVLDAAALTTLAAREQDDSSEANASSISFVLEYDGRRLLLTGDATSATLAQNIARYGAMVGEQRPRFDLVKLPHHGSGANVKDDLVASWTASRFLISSDGAGYRHPDDSAIARLLLAASGPVTFYANYPDGGPRQWADRAAEVNATFKLAKSATSGIAVTV